MLLRDVTERDRIEERLRQSEKLESVGLLAGGLAHDFNNLLTGLFGFIELARMNLDQPAQVESYLELAMGPFHRARVLTQQLLAFAKGSEPPKSSVVLEGILPGILRFTLGDGPLVWDIRQKEPVWPVLANEAQLLQVFENLALNAKQALGNQTGHLHIGLANVPSPGPDGQGLAPRSYVEVIVEDDGPGMPPEVLARVFDPFFTTKAGGTGLGLSICYSVVKKHGGVIEAGSTPGHGTRFRLYLPAVTPDREG
jgi:signal transduction histidine kinase